MGPERYDHAPHPRLGVVDPRRDDLELEAARWALREGMPILGICRGVQVLAVAAGGSLVQDIPSELRDAAHHDVRDFGFDHLCHSITIEPGSHLHAALGARHARVNSFHHQSVLHVPSDFFVSARADDDVIEAIESRVHPFAVGVQCHPEGMWQTTAPAFQNLFSAFVEASGRSVRARTA